MEWLLKEALFGGGPESRSRKSQPHTDLEHITYWRPMFSLMRLLLCNTG